MQKLSPTLLRDYRVGRQSQGTISNYLIPENSVKNSTNVNFDKVIGSACVRPGTTKLGNTVQSTKTPAGLGEFVGSGGSPNLLLVVYPTGGAGTGTLFYYNGSWNTSALTSLNNTAKCRFAQLGNNVFLVNGVDAMNASADGNTWATTNCITGAIYPSLLFRYAGRMLSAGDPTHRDRVYFSSVIDPTVSPFITWNTDTSSGDWIDINPDDGGNITGFSETSTFVLIFKSTGMYRLDSISKTVDPQNIFNVGAVSQEAIVLCQGVTYYFSGIDIRRTNGGYPEQISRAGVQDFVDAIPQANWTSVAAGTDGFNVLFSIGTVTLNSGMDDERTYTNVVLKFSPRDQNWSIHTYADTFKFFSPYTTSTYGRKLHGADTSGDVQTMDYGQTDNTNPIYFDLESQDLEFGNRAHLKEIADRLVVFTNNGLDSSLQFSQDGQDYKDLDITLFERVNIGENVNLKGFFFNYKWFGNSSKKPPVLEGIYVEDITDLGITNP